MMCVPVMSKHEKNNSEVSVSKLNQRFSFSAAEQCTKSACIDHWVPLLPLALRQVTSWDA